MPANLVEKEKSHAFAIDALQNYYKALKDIAALGVAKQAYLRLKKHSHNSKYQAYCKHLKRDSFVVK
ncbi:hypothetical protein [Ferruginibacter sp.]|uniref:hypothetical protein n=1 Tax=Ferruginibacter sp. TaxID=1940288 RepID=UPI002658F6C3|nr:hypothetical protein [Ferruginibacter sp.]